MPLSPEDSLKLNVLLHSEIEAVRIDEGRMQLYALTPTGESMVELNPNCRNDQYLKQVRETLSGHVLGSPGGYPVFLKRWTRMGQARDARLGDLLLLGEPEAVVAVSNAPGLTDELARRAWWIDPSSENARRMLASPAVASGAMGKVLAEHLAEHLAFETEPALMIDSVRLVLGPGLIDEVRTRKIWASGARKNAYRVGFLQAMPERLPEPRAAHAKLGSARAALASLTDNAPAMMLMNMLDAPGQSFLATARAILDRPADQDVVVALLNTIGTHLAPARLSMTNTQMIEDIIDETAQSLAHTDNHAVLTTLITAAPDLAAEIEALLVLSRLSDLVVTPIFARTSAEGTLMRKKIAPVTTPIFARLDILLGKGQ